VNSNSAYIRTVVAKALADGRSEGRSRGRAEKLARVLAYLESRKADAPAAIQRLIDALKRGDDEA